MPDFVDNAQDLERMARDAAIASACSALPSGPGRESCLDCGVAIPLARREAIPGVELCIHCQTEREEA